jgi:hypothetical protein
MMHFMLFPTYRFNGPSWALLLASSQQTLAAKTGLPSASSSCSCSSRLRSTRSFFGNTSEHRWLDEWWIGWERASGRTSTAGDYPQSSCCSSAHTHATWHHIMIALHSVGWVWQRCASTAPQTLRSQAPALPPKECRRTQSPKATSFKATLPKVRERRTRRGMVMSATVKRRRLPLPQLLHRCTPLVVVQLPAIVAVLKSEVTLNKGVGERRAEAPAKMTRSNWRQPQHWSCCAMCFGLWTFSHLTLSCHQTHTAATSFRRWWPLL